MKTFLVFGASGQTGQHFVSLVLREGHRVRALARNPRKITMTDAALDLRNEAADIEWVVHRAGIGSNGPSKGVLHRSADRFSIGTFMDCASYNYRTVTDSTAIHTCDFSTYRETGNA